MRLGMYWICALLAVAAGIGIAATSGAPGDLVVHEWGTFLAMSGSDGISLEGMYHEEHALPSFVHARSRDQLRLPSVVLKGETPVIYFYTDRTRKVRVDVRFPDGLWTQWYPQAQVVGPQFAQAATPPDLHDGRITWCAEVVPAGVGNPAPAPAPPETAKEAPWNFARDVDAAFVRTTDRTKEAAPHESERFLFYRGLGRAPLPLRLTAAEGGTLASDSGERHVVQHIFIVRVEGGRGVYTYLPALRPGERVTSLIPPMDGARPLPEFTRRLAADLASRLVESGLFVKEARAMVNTWRTSYFETEGVRALFVLPRATTDALIPMTVTPAPKELVRVMVGRLELLTPDRERAAEQAVRDLAAPDGDTRGLAFEFLRGQGRYVEPILRRVLAATGDESVRTPCRRLLLADFVTELRAAIHVASDGSRVADDPVHVRAQLASLLKEIGLDAEARSEGAAVAAALRERPEPPLDQAESRSYLRAFARAMEGLGDDREAARWYGRFIRFGSQVGTDRRCLGCHQDAGPRDLAWFRDWWAGRRYARATLRSGLGDEVVAGHEALVAKDPGDTATRMMLSYLYEARGAAAKAQALWAGLCAPASGAEIVATAGSARPTPRPGEPVQRPVPR